MEEAPILKCLPSGAGSPYQPLLSEDEHSRPTAVSVNRMAFVWEMCTAARGRGKGYLHATFTSAAEPKSLISICIPFPK